MADNDCGCAGKAAETKKGANVQSLEKYEMTEREMQIYQAGVAFGTAAAARQAAEAVNVLSQRLAVQAEGQAGAGQRLLDQIFASGATRAGEALGTLVEKLGSRFIGKRHRR